MNATQEHSELLTNAPFTEEQKSYLTGFLTGLKEGVRPYVGQTAEGLITHDAGQSVTKNQADELPQEEWFGTPLDEISKEEHIKRDENPLDIYEKIAIHAAEGRFPEGGDVFRFKFNGLFYVAPAEEAFMMRVRVPGNILGSHQVRTLAEIARRWGGGHADITTRGNIQIRQIKPVNTVDCLLKLQDGGLTSRGAGADNVRNITATPTSGIDPQELVDVLPLAKALQFYISNHRDLYGLPRKFNVAFDSGGSVSVVSDTNDIGFVAVKVPTDDVVPAGVYFKLLLGAVSGHEGMPVEAGVLVKPEECVSVAAAILRAYIKHGDRTNRKKARMKYTIEKLGLKAFLDEVESFLAFPLRYVQEGVAQGKRPVIRHGHVGIFRQKQTGMNYVGIQVSVGRLTESQLDQLASIADEFGKGELRTTVWQNVILPHIRDEDIDAVRSLIQRAGLDCSANTLRTGFVACTGNTGCKFSSTNTKGQAQELSRYLAEQLDMDEPINVHLTGCPHSCAQHYVGDIGLLGAMVTDESGTKVEGYHVYVGGGCDQDRGLGREVRKAVPFAELGDYLLHVLRTYLEKRQRGESFVAFTRRHEIDQLRTLFAPVAH